MDILKRNKRYITVSAFVLAAGGLSALLSGGFDTYKLMEKPPFSPPGWVFPIVWSVLYILMAVAAVTVAESNDLDKTVGVKLFIAQLVINLIWPIIFFRFSAAKLALFWLLALIVLVILTIRSFFSVSKRAGWLMIPYILWLFAAFYLNFGIVALNS